MRANPWGKGSEGGSRVREGGVYVGRRWDTSCTAWVDGDSLLRWGGLFVGSWAISGACCSATSAVQPTTPVWPVLSPDVVWVWVH